MNKESFHAELTGLINKYGLEREADMPDYLLAEMVVRMLAAVGPCVKKNLEWHGCDSVCHPKQGERTCG